MTEQDLIFALDIGTRTVIGIAGYHDGDRFKILAYDVEEHKERAMYDGQVHDIDLVAKAAKKVKEKIEKKLNLPLKRVSIAAAGRSLRTCKIFVEREVDSTIEIDKELISSLEIEGIQLAQKEIERMQHEDDTAYYCAGYAVINYYLNGSIIGNLVGHKCKKAGVEVLATFLPRIVVDSLYSVMSRVDLEVCSLTLEPIAAMNVSIHSNLRLLNIALVDIGAGTSDIALTKGGTVFAFAMVPTAGDEITEKIAENYLLDFDTAEKVKIELGKKKTLKFKDIMEISYEKTAEEIIDSIKPAIKSLANDIGNKILEFNGKPPSAVFLVGGGSQIPYLPDYLSEILQIPIERVGVRNTSIIKDVEIKGKKLSGPEYITPIGIAVTAHMNREKDFLQVRVNDRLVKLLNSKTLTVADALILVGFNPRNLIGRRGNALAFKLNGKDEIIKGEPGEAAKIYLSGSKVSLDQIISNGDSITIEPALDGRSGSAYIKDYLASLDSICITVNGDLYNVKAEAFSNSSTVDVNYEIRQNDEVIIKPMDKLSDIIDKLELDYDYYEYYINGKRAYKDDIISDGDEIEYKAIYDNSNPSVQRNSYCEVTVTINGNKVIMQEAKQSIIFVDIFNYIDLDLNNVKGKLILLLNGEKVNYTDVLKNGDNIEVRCE